MVEYTERFAKLSEDGKFRYWLMRHWGPGKSRMTFVMLNPSTADTNADDPTIRKCVGFAQRHGYSGIEVVNLFAYRATDPKELKAAGWQTGGDVNRRMLTSVLVKSGMRAEHIVCAWGANARNRPEAQHFRDLARRLPVTLHALRTSADGTPHHPLMLPYDCKLEEF